MSQIKPMKQPNKLRRVTFFQVKTPQEKFQLIIQKATTYFEKKEPLLIWVKSKEAAKFTDHLLWNNPVEGFLPHTVKETLCDDLITITHSSGNPNRSNTVFNLTTEAILTPFFHNIYEFEDLSCTQKNHLAQKRYHAYKDAGFQIISL